MFTSKLNPKLASHAPNVNRIILIVLIDILISVVEYGSKITKLKSIPSRERRAIRRCWRCEIIVITVIKKEICRKSVFDTIIELRESQF
jgi:hypothetical protein